MKLSEKLYSNTMDLWNASAEKPFVVEMAEGTLEDRLFKNYTIQDYLYLLDYIEILKKIRSLSESEEMFSFLSTLIKGITNEVERVHLANIRKYGISDDEIKGFEKISAISDYVSYMQKCIDDHGFYGGLTALLQCSWLYAYIGETVVKKYSGKIAGSKYQSWFEAYTSQSYLKTNQTWINMLDSLGADLDDQTVEELSGVFRECAKYENKLWDALYEL
ncbi:MAG: hypothetical protein J5825_07425 [Lachnospiraceae bacterium]|nr:hypothetical protein [Lachnospiraceae bacterium]